MDQLLIKGWVRTRRDSKGFSFIEINDGSSLKNIQVVADEQLPNYDDVKKTTTGSALAVRGSLIESKGGGQKWEIQATAVDIINLAPEDFPLQKKRHTDEFLRTTETPHQQIRRRLSHPFRDGLRDSQILPGTGLSLSAFTDSDRLGL
jgi:asparaginyl-tRNA synthetase